MHNSVNYLQCYYQSFVPAKPASLMAPLPRTLEELINYTEQDIRFLRFDSFSNECIKPCRVYGVVEKTICLQQRDEIFNRCSKISAN